MTRVRTALALYLIALASGCARPRVATPAPDSQVPMPDSQALIVLLRDPAQDALGGATVSNALGSTALAAERDSTQIVANRPPGPATTKTEDDVQALFGEALSAQPPPPLHFILNFRVQSDELTEASQALVPDILREVGARPAPDVTVIGHTDTTGDGASNFKLGLDRAMRVQRLLIEAGLDAALIETTSHGETDLLVPTPDGTSEPRNRRVEIAVR